MGADIHMVVERKHEDRWIGLHAFPSAKLRVDPGETNWPSFVARARNYDRFARLAAVRGDGPSPLGLPDDISDLGQLMVDDYGSDGHSHTYWSLKDAGVVFLATGDDAAVLLKPPESSWEIAAWFGVHEEADLTDYRVIMWFDN